MEFNKRLYTKFVVPGIIIEVILLFIFVFPHGFDVRFFGPIGGPAGIVANVTLSLFYITFLVYLLISGITAAFLTYKYYRRKEKFIKSTQRFLIISVIYSTILDIMIIYQWIACSDWGLIDNLNVPFLIVLSIFSFIMTFMFYYWCIKISKFKRQNKVDSCTED